MATHGEHAGQRLLELCEHNDPVRTAPCYDDREIPRSVAGTLRLSPKRIGNNTHNFREPMLVKSQEHRYEATKNTAQTGLPLVSESPGNGPLEYTIVIENNDEVRRVNRLGNLRWFVLFICALLTCCLLFVEDSAVAIHDPLKDYFANGVKQPLPFEYFFNLWFSMYAVANIAAPLFVGIISDRFGDAFTLPGYTFGLIVVNVLIAVGTLYHNEPLILFSGILGGVFLEALRVVTSVVVSNWLAPTKYTRGHVAAGLAVLNCMERLGYVATNIVSQAISQEFTVPAVFWFGVIFLAVSFLFTLPMPVLERFRIRMLKIDSTEESEDSLASKQSLAAKLQGYPIVYWLLVIALGFFFAVFYSAGNVLAAFLVERDCGGSCCGDPEDLTCSAQLVAQEKASYMMNIPSIVMIVGTPLVGLLVDKVGKRATGMVYSSLFSTVACSFYSFEAIPVWVPLVFQGITLGVYLTCAVPCINTLAEETGDSGLAFGLAFSIENIFLTFYPVATAAVRKLVGAYTGMTQIYFTGTMLIVFILSVIIYILDLKVGNGLLNKREEFST